MEKMRHSVNTPQAVSLFFVYNYLKIFKMILLWLEG